MELSRIRFAFPWRIALILALLRVPATGFGAQLLGGSAPAAAVLSGGILAQFRKPANWGRMCPDSNPMAHGDAPAKETACLFPDVTEGGLNDLLSNLLPLLLNKDGRA